MEARFGFRLFIKKKVNFDHRNRLKSNPLPAPILDIFTPLTIKNGFLVEFSVANQSPNNGNMVEKATLT